MTISSNVCKPILVETNFFCYLQMQHNGAAYLIIVHLSLRILHKDRAPLEVGALYWQLHDSVVNCELMMLRSLQFHVAFNNPHKVTFSDSIAIL